MTRIIYGVSPIGLGHASRAAAVGIRLRATGLEPIFATGGPASRFLASYGFDVHDIVTEPTPSEKGGRMQYPSLWYLRYWSGYRSTRSKMRSLIDSTNPDVIVGDEEFSCVSLAMERGIPHALISDELELGFAQTAFSRYVEKRVDAWYRDLQRRASAIFVPDFGEDRGNLHFVSPIVREPTKTREQVRAEIGIGPADRMILLSLSGSGIGRFLLDAVAAAVSKLALPDVELLVSGLPAGPPFDRTRYIGFQRDNQDLVSAADLVVSTAGKSTIDEAASCGTPLIAIPLRHHSEQERNAASLGFSPGDLNHLDELVPRYLGRRAEPRNYRGSDAAAALIRALPGTA